MYSFNFYLWCYGVVVFFALPCIFLILIIYFINQPRKTKKLTLSALNQRFQSVNGLKDAELLYENFLTHFIRAPSNQKDLQEWLTCIANFSNFKLFDLDRIVDFRQKLEEQNEVYRSEIQGIIATALKAKKQ